MTSCGSIYLLCTVVVALLAGAVLLDPSGDNVCHVDPHDRQKGIVMLYTIAIVLLILWLIGFIVMPIGGSLIHLLLAIAVVVIVIQLLTGRRVL